MTFTISFSSIIPILLTGAIFAYLWSKHSGPYRGDYNFGGAIDALIWFIGFLISAIIWLIYWIAA